MNYVYILPIIMNKNHYFITNITSILMLLYIESKNKIKLILNFFKIFHFFISYFDHGILPKAPQSNT